MSTTDYRSPDFVLLLHCMAALAQPGGQATGSLVVSDAAYRKAKHCFQVVESHGIISIRVLQASLLLCLYEASNAIYPAAFLTASHCARLGQAMGIHDRRNVSQMFPVPSK